MGFCPFLSKSNIKVNLPSFTADGGSIGTLDETGGDLNLPSFSITPDYDPTISFGDIVEVQCESSCAMWIADESGEGGYCAIAGIGPLVSTLLKPSPTDSTDSKTVGDLPIMVNDLINDVIGTSTDLGTLDIYNKQSKLVNLLELPDLFRKVIGDDSDLSKIVFEDGSLSKKLINILELINQFYKIIGNDGSLKDPNGETILNFLSKSKLQEYLEKVLGTDVEKKENSIIQGVESLATLQPYFEDVLGTNEDKNEEEEKVIHLTKILNLFREVIGTAEERDEEAPLITYFQNVLGKKSDLDEDITLAKLKDHIHKQHYHYMPHHYTLYTAELFGESGGRGTIPKAAVLANEFLTKEDLDGNTIIYGDHFKIKDSKSKPIMLYGLETHPLWEDPGVEISWEEYLSYFE
jgi:hypothetical protein